ncbi:MAG: TPM domain-containing protein [Brachymonas sp.]|nr:TPM domain-containing protein [Brachymonas sp.]
MAPTPDPVIEQKMAEKPQATTAELIAHYLPPEVLDRLQQTVAECETQHTGQLLLCIEASLPPSYVERNATPRERAMKLFGKYGVWDTEDNNGAMLYLLMDRHCIELVADRALHRKVAQEEWTAIVQQLCEALRTAQYESGLKAALQQISSHQIRHFPADGNHVRENTVPDKPLVLR